MVLVGAEKLVDYFFLSMVSPFSGILSGRTNVRPNRVWQNNSRYSGE